MAIDERAVSGAEVLDDDFPILGGNLGVFSRDLIVDEQQVRVALATDHKFQVRWQRKLPAGILPRDERENKFEHGSPVWQRAILPAAPAGVKVSELAFRRLRRHYRGQASPAGGHGFECGVDSFHQRARLYGRQNITSRPMPTIVIVAGSGIACMLSMPSVATMAYRPALTERVSLPRRRRFPRRCLRW